MLDDVGRSKHQSSARRMKPVRRLQPPVDKPGRPQQVPQVPAPEVLERIERMRLARAEAEAELAMLVDQATGLSIGWREIAARLGVTRQAARQQYRRRHRDSAICQDRVA